MHAALKNHDVPSVSFHPAPDKLSKDDLLILAANRFCGDGSHDRLSTDQFKEAFYLLIGSCSETTKKFIAQILAHCAYTPRTIALYFALEPLAISTAVLADSLVLGQLDLLQIIEMKGEDYAQIIAGRPDIGPSVIKRLREFDSESVNVALASNKALINDAEDRSADSLFKEILKNDLNDASETVAATDSSDKPTELNGSEQALLAAAARGGRLDITTPEVPVHEPFDFGSALEKSARAHSHQGMAVLMQKKMGLAYETAQQILADKSGDTFAVLMRASEVDPAQANRILLLTFPSIGLSAHNAMRAIRFYEQLKPESCRTAVKEWPKAEPVPVHHQPHLQDGSATARLQVRRPENQTRQSTVVDPAQDEFKASA